MTLVTAWVRRTPGGEELVVASDSRITGGISLDHAPKIFRLERNDAVIAYCGPTLVAYPILLQIKSGLDSYEETRNRVVDIVHLKSHIEKTIERLRYLVQDLPCKDDTNRSFQFLLAGYSWKTACFCVWKFRFDAGTRKFNAYSMLGSKRFVFMSDRPENEKMAKRKLIRRIFPSGSHSAKPINWEPLKVLLEIIEDDSVSDIGGPPQIVKIYKHANTLPINVLWYDDEYRHGLRQRNFNITHLGRPLLTYERSRYLTLDPQTWKLVEPWKTRELIQLRTEHEASKLTTLLRERICRAIARVRDKKNLQEVLTNMIAAKRPFAELSRLMNGH